MLMGDTPYDSFRFDPRYVDVINGLRLGVTQIDNQKPIDH
jgi:hypothetical protein